MKTKDDLSTIHKRLKYFIEGHLKTTARKFALSLDKVNPSVVSNIIGGRLNEPSNNLLMKIKKKYPPINLEWLIMGEGEILLESSKNENLVNNTKMSAKNPKITSDVPNNKVALKKQEREIMSPIIKRIKTLRLGAGLTDDEMAKLLGMSLTGYASIEQEKVFFSVPKLIRIRSIFKRSYLYLLEGIDEKTQQVDSKKLEEKDTEIKHLNEKIALLTKQIDLMEQLRNKK